VQRNGRVLNSKLAGAMVRLGHRDRIVVTDAGLPLPWTIETIDLAVVPGVPSLAQVLEAILGDLKVDTAILADEFAPASPATYLEVASLLDGYEVRTVPHKQLEEMLGTVKLAIRTGECSHFANVVLVAGVTF
jgi:D-ribose pyranase